MRQKDILDKIIEVTASVFPAFRIRFKELDTAFISLLKEK